MLKWNYLLEIARSFLIKEKVQKPLTGIDWKRYPKELAPKSALSKKSKSSSSKRSSSIKVKIDQVKKRKLANEGGSDKDITAELFEKLEKVSCMRVLSASGRL